MNDLLVIDGKSQVASACLDGKIYMLDLHLHQVTKALSGHKKSVSMLRYNAENGYLVSAGLDHSVQVWNPHVEQKIASLTGHRNQLIGMEVVPDTNQIITADDGGLVKIWDLRKFAAVQTIAKELYVKDHTSARNVARTMSSMCYISSKKRIAIAHSTVFFIDQAQTAGDNTDCSSSTSAEHFGEDEDDDEIEEAKKPVSIFYCPPTQCFVALTSWDMKSWNVNSGELVRTASPIIGSEMTCACIVGDFFSCFVGTENGIVARVAIPNGSVIVQKRVHSSEITAIQWLEEKKQVVSSATSGNIVIARYDTLDVVFKLNHWRGVQSASSAFFNTPALSDERTSECGVSPPEYSVPHSLRAFFYGNEIERLMRIFGQVDAARCGSIPLTELPYILETAFPTTFSDRKHEVSKTKVRGASADPKAETITFASLLEILRDSLSALQEGGASFSEHSTFSVSALGMHSQLHLLVSGSSTDGTFCVWNAKNGAVIAQGTSGETTSRQREPVSPSISQIVFLHPLPYFACIEAGSCSLEIWSTIPVPPILSHSFERFIRFTHTLPARFHPNAGIKVPGPNHFSSFFITETAESRSDRQKTKPPEVMKDTTILAIQWCSGSTQDDKFLCVADDQGEFDQWSREWGEGGRLSSSTDTAPSCSNLTGYITLYDFDSVAPRVAAVVQRTQVRQLSEADNKEHPPNDESSSYLTPQSLRKLHQWSAHSSTAVRSLEILRIHGQAPMIASLTQNGCVSLWSVDGQLLGRLNDQPHRTRHYPSAARAAPVLWKLRVDGVQAKSAQVNHAELMLQRIEHKSLDGQADSARAAIERNARRQSADDARASEGSRVVGRLLSVSSLRSPSSKV